MEIKKIKLLEPEGRPSYIEKDIHVQHYQVEGLPVLQPHHREAHTGNLPGGGPAGDKAICTLNMGG